MDKQYYLNKLGLVKLVQQISSLIKSHTSNEISYNETLDQNDDPVITLNNPNHFTTVNAVTDYLKNHNIITINQDSTSPTNNSYTVVSNSNQYNGEENKVIDIKLASASDIDSLFT